MVLGGSDADTVTVNIHNLVFLAIKAHLHFFC